MKDWKGMERSIAKILGDWWGCNFRRTPSSGAWNTQSRKMGQDSTDFHGDIVAPPEANFPFSVECKAYKEVEIYKALYGKSNIFDWWAQCREDAKAAGKYPLLVMKENRKNALVVISKPVYDALFVTGAPNNFIPVIRLQWTINRTVYIMDLKLFVESLPVKHVKKVLC